MSPWGAWVGLVLCGVVDVLVERARRRRWAHELERWLDALPGLTTGERIVLAIDAVRFVGKPVRLYDWAQEGS